MERLEMRPVADWAVYLDDDGRPYWSGGSWGDMDRTDFDPNRPLVMDPRHFRPGTMIAVSEPADQQGSVDRVFRPLQENRMNDYMGLQNRIARVLWDRFAPDADQPQGERAPWLEGRWVEAAGEVMKQVAANDAQETKGSPNDSQP